MRRSMRNIWQNLNLFTRAMLLVAVSALALAWYVGDGLPRVGLIPLLGILWVLAWLVLRHSQNALQACLTAQNFSIQEEQRAYSHAVMVAETDLDGRIIQVNDRFCAVLGCTREDVLGLSHPLFGSPAQPDQNHRKMWDTLLSSQIWCGEFHAHARDLREYWVQITAVPILDGQQLKPHHFKIIGIDISQQRQTERMLQHERAQNAVTLASIGDAVICTDSQGQVISVNKAATVLTGCSGELARGQQVVDMIDVVHEMSRQPLGNPLMRVLQDRQELSLDADALLRSRCGAERGIEGRAAPVLLEDGSLIAAVLVFHDVSEERRLMSAVRWQAGHDALTHLPNRNLLQDCFNRAFAEARANESLTAVCLLDLDDFKPINDRYGHETGDAILVEIAARLVNVLRTHDTVARLGGDEFVLLLNGFRQVDEIDPLLDKILAVIAAPFTFGSTVLNVCGSIGLTMYPLDDADADTLLRHADQAMYQAKQAGRSRYHLFDLAGDQMVQSSSRQVERLRLAFARDEFVLYYQPKVNMRTGQVVGMEALLRWLHPERGVVLPMEFLPVIEQNDLIIQLGEWVIEQALHQMASWLEKGRAWSISVNIAGLHFQQSNFCERLTMLLARYSSVPPGLLQIEILESAALGDLQQARSTVQACQMLGVSFALEDFGTGYSSLSYLKNLSVDVLKIDQSFVRDMILDKSGLSLVEAVVSMARVFDSEVVAEGVEAAEYGVLLIRLGCDLGQG